MKKSITASREIRLNNVLFPIWMLLLIPSAWLVVIPANFVIDSAVLLITFAVLAHKRGESGYRPWRDWLRCILPVWLLGFASDLIGAGFMLFWGYVPSALAGDSNTDWWTTHVTDPISQNPFTDFWALLFTALAIALAGLMIYLFAKKISLRRSGLDDADKRRAALALAIATAPYVMLIPSEWLWSMGY